MDYSELDKVRRSDNPAAARRRRVVRATAGSAAASSSSAATIIGLSMASITAIIAACSGTTTSPGASGAARRQWPGARPAARSASPCQRPEVGRPGRDAWTSAATASPPSRSSSCATQHTIGDPGVCAPGLATEWTPERGRHRLDVQAPPGREVADDGSPFTSADVVATMERLVEAGNSGPQGRPRQGRRRRDRRRTRSPSRSPAPTATSRTSCRSTTPRRSSPRPTTSPARRSTSGPTGTGAWKLDKLRPARRARSSTGTPTGGAAKTPLDGTEFIFFDATGPMITAYQGGQVDAIVQFDVLTGASLFDDANFTPDRHPGGPPSPDLDAHATPASSPRRRSARRSP